MRSRERYVLRDVLRRVSRSFYLTLAILPRGMAKHVGLAYLFARAADTIADTGHMIRSERVELLRRLKRQFVHERVDWDDIASIQTTLVAHGDHPGERALMEHLDACFQVYEGCDRDDRDAIRRVLPILIGGMETDVERFPGESDAQLAALPSMEALDDYVYGVAGCVGEFWTQLMFAHAPHIRRTRDEADATRMGIRFGKGLQLTNILKDIPRDLRRGRCYIPLECLTAAGLTPRDLLDARTMPTFSPILHQLMGITLAHLDQGWRYVLSIPRRNVRLRLACMWPILIALKTLHRLATCDNVLDPAHTLKISRSEVYRIVAVTTMTGGCGYTGTVYWGHLRKAVGQTLTRWEGR